MYVYIYQCVGVCVAECHRHHCVLVCACVLQRAAVCVDLPQSATMPPTLCCSILCVCCSVLQRVAACCYPSQVVTLPRLIYRRYSSFKRVHGSFSGT